MNAHSGPKPGTGSLPHRTDVDGLRALAVLPIILFHAGWSALQGGFAGVDIFFLISGYLITAIITREIDAGTFTLAGFYRRRVVRIFPALFAMLAICLLAGLWLLFGSELRLLTRTAGFTALSLSNFLFWREVGYFAPSAESNLLLHTWSLAVEEQFYLLYPLFLLLLAKLGLSRRTGLWLVILLSLAAGGVLAQLSANAAFYLLPSRAWELGLGGLVAVGGFPRIARQSLRQLVAGLGLLLIGGSLLAVRQDLMWPVPWAVPVCLGTACILAYGQGTTVDRLLSLAPLRLVGRISYSAYLWHWPIITYYRISFGYALHWRETVLLVVASLVAGALSYRLVEQPFLRRWRLASPRPVLLAGLLAIVASVAVCLAASAQANWLSQFSPRAKAIAAFAEYDALAINDRQYGPPGCFISQSLADSAEAQRQASCEHFSNDRPTAVLVGDSFAAQLAQAMQERYPHYSWSFELASGCRPVIGGTGTPRCRQIMDRLYTQVLRERRVDMIVVAGKWQAGDMAALPATLAALRASGTRVQLLGPMVHYDSSFALLYARAVAWGDAAAVTRRRVPLERDLERQMRHMADRAGVAFVSMIDLECGPRQQCPILDPDGNPLRWDQGHLTLPGSRWVVGRLPDPAGGARP